MIEIERTNRKQLFSYLFAEEVGIVLDFKPRGWQSEDHRDPDCDVWNDAIVLWPGFGVGYNMRAMLEVVNESG